MWEDADGQFAMLPGDHCRAIEADDAGRRIFGIAVKPDTLAMYLTAPWRVRLLQYTETAIALAAVLALIVVLVRVEMRRAIVPLLLLGLALLVVAIDDASFIGGVRPYAASCRIFWPGMSTAPSKAARRFFTTAAPGCAISARSSMWCSARATSVICLWCCCCRS